MDNDKESKKTNWGLGTELKYVKYCWIGWVSYENIINKLVCNEPAPFRSDGLYGGIDTLPSNDIASAYDADNYPWKR